MKATKSGLVSNALGLVRGAMTGRLQREWRTNEAVSSKPPQQRFVHKLGMP